VGHEVIVVTSDRHFPFPEYEATVKNILGDRVVGAGLFDDKGVSIMRLPTVFEIASRVWLKGLSKTLRTLQPDIIICHSSFGFSAIRLSFIAKHLKAKIVFDEHITPNVVREGWLSRMAYGLYRLFFSRQIESVAHKIVGVSDSCTEILRGRLGFSREKTETICLGTDLSIFYPDAQKRLSKRSELGIEPDSVVVLYTGKIYGEKKVHHIIRAIDALNHPDLRIVSVIVGGVGKDYEAEWSKWVSEAQHRVITIPNVGREALAYFYNAADIATWPAHTSISTIDASACACPIICSDYLSERYKKNSGFGIIDGDYEDFARALHALLLNRALREEMGKNALKLAQEEFDWQRIAQRFIV
jgi:glycosyltransferase involved in cell wall biosynthesis